MKLSLLKPFMGFIKSAVMSQLRGLAYTGAGLLVSHGWLAKNQGEAAAGVIFFVGTALFQLLDNFVVDGKLTYATNNTAPVNPVVSVTVAAATAMSTGVVPPMATPQVTMSPIPNPKGS